MSSQFVEKKILEELMPKFEPEMARKMMVNSIFMMDEMEKFAISPGDFNIQIRSIKDESCFRIKFSLPVYVLFHIATKNLQRVHVYYRRENFASPVGFIPVYNCNLNHLTLLRSYSKASDWKNKMSSVTDEEVDYSCKKFSNNSGENMEQSSLNFLLQNNSTSTNLSAKDSQYIENAFEFLYWRLPTSEMRYRYSTIHNFLYHNVSKIFSAHRIFKTLVKIIDVGKKRYSQDFPKKIKYVHAKGYVLCQKEKNLFFQKTNLWISEPDASKINPNMLINVIMDKPILYKQTNMPLIVHGIVGKSIPVGDQSHLISVVLWKQLQEVEGKDLCYVGKTSEIENQVEKLITENPAVFEKPWKTEIKKNFKKSVDELFPLILDLEGDLYHLPSPLLSYIITKNNSILNDASELVNLLKFVDKVNPKTRYGSLMKLRTSPIGNEVQKGPYGKHWKDLMSDANRIANRIVYSRIFSKASSEVM
jgi:hypothetical protein